MYCCTVLRIQLALVTRRWSMINDKHECACVVDRFPFAIKSRVCKPTAQPISVVRIHPPDSELKIRKNWDSRKVQLICNRDQPNCTCRGCFPSRRRLFGELHWTGKCLSILIKPKPNSVARDYRSFLDLILQTTRPMKGLLCRILLSIRCVVSSANH